MNLQDLQRGRGAVSGAGWGGMVRRGPWPPRDTHVDKLQLPEVLHSVDGAVATGQERMDIVLQPQ